MCRLARRMEDNKRQARRPDTEGRSYPTEESLFPGERGRGENRRERGRRIMIAHGILGRLANGHEKTLMRPEFDLPNPQCELFPNIAINAERNSWRTCPVPGF
jgi:hypothetical protein